jgi:hypothetical protein
LFEKILLIFRERCAGFFDGPVFWRVTIHGVERRLEFRKKPENKKTTAAAVVIVKITGVFRGKKQ